MYKFLSKSTRGLCRNNIEAIQLPVIIHPTHVHADAYSTHKDQFDCKYANHVQNETCMPTVFGSTHIIVPELQPLAHCTLDIYIRVICNRYHNRCRQ